MITPCSTTVEQITQDSNDAASSTRGFAANELEVPFGKPCRNHAYL